ncbi:MAG: hypothetical protein GX796_04280 [Clostridiaceae bacterium]|nr:hypothetical protein [Clostridiaceae bacterium]
MAKRLKWGTIEYLNTLIDEYFDTEETPTLAGLCLHLKISRECWNYYISEKWKVHRKSEKEIEEVMKNKDVELIEEAFEDLLEITDKRDSGTYDSIEDVHIKALVSDSLKKAHMRYTAFIEKSIIGNKNPAGPIFLAKATLGYRETAPEQTEQNRLPAAINIVVMPQPEKPQALQYVEVKPKLE